MSKRRLYPESFDAFFSEGMERLERAMESMDATMERAFGDSTPLKRKGGKSKMKTPKQAPKFTTPGRIAVNGKIPRWASPWVSLIHHDLPPFEIHGQMTQVERACTILENLLLAGFTPPNADKDALQRWREMGDPKPTDESAEAEEVKDGTENTQGQEEA